VGADEVNYRPGKKNAVSHVNPARNNIPIIQKTPSAISLRWRGIGAIPPWAWILGLQLALVLPFVGQPIHIDDSVYVDIGRNVLKTPWHAHDFSYIFEGRTVADMASHSHPPFVGYWIGLLLWLFGDGPQ